MARYYVDGQLPDKDYYKIPKYPILIESLKVFLLFFFGAMFIWFTAYDVADGYDYSWFAAGFFLMPWISSFMRRWVGNIFIYSGLHALFLGWLFLSPDKALTLLGAIFWVALTLYGAARQLSKESEREASLFVLGVTMAAMVLIYILAVNRDRMGFIIPLIITSSLYGVLFLYYQHWIGVHDALRNIDKEGNFSIKRTIGFNTKLFVGFMALAVVFLTAMYFAGMGDLINWLSYMLILFIKKAGRYLASIEGNEEYIEPEEETDEIIQESNGFGNFETYTSPFWVFLQYLLEILFVLLVLVLIGYACYYIFRRFNEVHKYQEQGYEETKVFYKSIPKEKRPRRSLRSLFDTSPENRIRRAYYKKVRTQMGKKVQPYETPTEVAETLTDVQELVEAYDEARYANQDLKPSR